MNIDKLNILNDKKNSLMLELNNRLLFSKLFFIADNDIKISVGAFRINRQNQIKSNVIYLTCSTEDRKIELLKFKESEFKKILPDLKIQDRFNCPEKFQTIFYKTKKFITL